ncbi:hypothetical protein N8292_00515 [Gammaproteobacteria bacterium]|nr:hypothetical protein [Gammaproteobacteria bacterium]
MDAIAQSQIELNKQYGKNLVRIAWGIEIIAASIGLFIGVSSAYTTIGYYADMEDTVRAGNVFTNVFIGAAPFIIIAAVELTKIPLALGFYRTKRLVWRLLFLVTLFMLVFVTFETLFNGLERNFSALESKIQKPRNAYQEQKATLANMQTSIDEATARTVEQINEDFAVKISEAATEGRLKISSIEDERDAEIKKIDEQINRLSESLTVAADASGLQQKVDRIRSDIKTARENATAQIQSERDAVSASLENIDISIQKIDENMTSEMNNKGFLTSASGIRAAAKEIRDIQLANKKQISESLEAKINDIDNRLEAYILAQNIELKSSEANLTTSQASMSGMLGKNLDTLQARVDDKMQQYSKLIEEANISSNKNIERIETEREAAKEIQSNREKGLPALEQQRMVIRTEIIKLENEINMAARENNIYRITGRFYDRESAAEITVEELKVVTSIWFGSIALIASLVGAVLALAGFVLQDPESYKPVLNKKRPFQNAARGILIRLRKFYTYRKTGVLRTTLRSLLVDIRRWMRAPRIKYVEVKVPHEVIKEVPGPERVVYKEVPKEIIKNEIVYVPLYSVEEGTVMKDKVIQESKEQKDD